MPGGSLSRQYIWDANFSAYEHVALLGGERVTFALGKNLLAGVAWHDARCWKMHCYNLPYSADGDATGWLDTVLLAYLGLRRRLQSGVLTATIRI